MAVSRAAKTTFEAQRTIQPFYTGGSVGLSSDGRTFAATLGEDVTLTDLSSGVELGRIEGDGEPITCLSLVPDASHLITCSRSLSMRIYSLERVAHETKIEATLLRSIRPHTAPVVVSATDSTGTLLATGGADGVIKVWDIRAGYTTHTFHGHSGVISALHFFQLDASTLPAKENPKSRHRDRRAQTDDEDNASTLGFRLASGGEDCKVRIWDLHKRKAVATLESHLSVVRSIEYSAYENVLVTASRDTTVSTWDARIWKKRSTLAVSEAIESCGFVADGKIIFTGGERGCVRLWSTAHGNEITEQQQEKPETEAIVDIQHLPNLPFLLSVQADQTIFLHDLSPLVDLTYNGTIPPLPLQQRVYGTHDEVIDLAYLGRGSNYLALATNIEDVRIISLTGLNSGRPDAEPGGHFGADVATLKGHEDIIICMDVDWSGHWLATGAKDNTARLWLVDAESGSFVCYATFTGHAESISAIALPRSRPQPGSAAFEDPMSIAPDYLLTGSQDLTVKRWTVGNNKEKDPRSKAVRAIYTRKAHDKDINAIDTNDRGTLFASASQDRIVKIWSLEEGQVQGVLRGHKRGVWAVRFAPHGSSNMVSGAGKVNSSRGLVLTGSGDKTVRVWNLADYSCLLTLEGHSNSVLKVMWLPSLGEKDNERGAAQVVSAGGDGLIKVWSLGTGECECTLDNHTDRVWALAVRPSQDGSDQIDEMDEDETQNEKPRRQTAGMVSGGGDGVLTFWADTTEATLIEMQQKEKGRIEQDQQLSNLIFAKKYQESIALALQLDHPGKLLSIFTSVMDNPEDGENAQNSIMGRKEVDDVLIGLADSQIYQLLLRIRDWNTNARTADIAQRVLHTLVMKLPADRLASVRVPESDKFRNKGRSTSLRDLYSSIRAYTERHLRRVEDLVEQSYLLDFTLREMDEVAGSAPVHNGVNGINGTYVSGNHVDVNMTG